jgi:hypothetical protein
MMPYTVHRSASETWTATPVYYGGREYRRVRFANGVRVTWAVVLPRPASPARFTGTLISWRRAS